MDGEASTSQQGVCVGRGWWALALCSVLLVSAPPVAHAEGSLDGALLAQRNLDNGALLAQAQEQPAAVDTSVPSAEVLQAIVGRRVEVVLVSGMEALGELLSADAGGILIAQEPSGSLAQIPRSDISSLRLAQEVPVAARLRRRHKATAKQVRPRLVGRIAQRQQADIVAHHLSVARAHESANVLEADHVARGHATARQASNVAAKDVKVKEITQLLPELRARQRRRCSARGAQQLLEAWQVSVGLCCRRMLAKHLVSHRALHRLDHLAVRARPQHV